MGELRLGEILLERGYLTREDLERCLQIQAFATNRKPLGEILVEEGILSHKAMVQLLRIQERRRTHATGALQEQTDAPPGPDQPRAGDLLGAARDAGASDLLLSQERPPRVRVAGTVRPLWSRPLSTEALWEAVKELLGPETLERLPSEKTLVVCRSWQGCRFRASLFLQAEGMAVAIRLVPETLRSLKDLGFGSQVQDLLKHRRGLILVSGPVGSGRTTTLASMVDTISDKHKVRILVLEDAFEIRVLSLMSMISYRQVGIHTPSYAAALRSTLRSAPDVIVVDRIPDKECLELMLHRAQEGRLVIGGLNACDTLRAFHRLQGIFPHDEQPQLRGTLASVLLGIVSQQLVATADGKGLAMAHEVLVPNGAMRNLIREGKFQQIPFVMQLQKDQGCLTLDQSLSHLCAEGKVSPDDALGRAGDKARMLKILAGEAVS